MKNNLTMSKINNKKMRKYWILLSICVLIIIIKFIQFYYNNDKIIVSSCKPQISTIVETIPANGKIQPVTEVKISPDVSGEIIELNYEEGDFVKKGDLIIKIKQDVYISLLERSEASLNSIKAQYLQQKAQLVQAELSFNRSKGLFKKGAIPKSEYESSDSQYKIAKEQLKSAEYNIQSATASLNEAKENLSKTMIYSPIDGVISRLNIEKGERVVGTSQMAGTEMLRIANFNEMEVLVEVNENDIIRLNELDTASINIDAYHDRTFKGIVTQIASSAKNIGASTNQVTNFEVKIKLLRESYFDLITDNNIPFRPGMSASVNIQTDRKENIITLPIECITTDRELSKTTTTSISEYVYIIIKDTAKLHKIKTGIQDFQKIEITNGLDTNYNIVSGPYNTIHKILKNGSNIKIKNE